MSFTLIQKLLILIQFATFVCVCEAVDLPVSGNPSCNYFLENAIARKANLWDWNAKRKYQTELFWSPERFTPPAKHNPNDFMYIIHTTRVNLDRDLEGDLEKAIAEMNDPTHGPADIISASVISNRGSSTQFGPKYALILSSPSDNILATSPVDMATANFWEPDGSRAKKIGIGRAYEPRGVITRKDYDKFAYNKYGIRDPNSLLYTTKYNEIAISKTSAAGNVQVTGILYYDGTGVDVTDMIDVAWYDTKPEEIAKLKAVSQKLGLPLISLKPPASRIR